MPPASAGGRGPSPRRRGRGASPPGRAGDSQTRGRGNPLERRRPRLTTVAETSAGGLVVDLLDGRHHGVLIGRHDRRGRMLWSLPKGHIEPGETAEQAAVREIREETGISGHVVEPLGDIDFWFVAEDRRIHKTVHHFLLNATGGELSDADIEVAAVAWVPLAEITEQLAYDDERELASRAIRLLDRSA